MDGPTHCFHRWLARSACSPPDCFDMELLRGRASGYAPAMTGSRSAANAAIFYQPEGYDTSRPKLMGRHAAGEGFLKGFLRHSGVDTLYCYAATKEFGRAFPAPGRPASATSGRCAGWMKATPAIAARPPARSICRTPASPPPPGAGAPSGQKLYSITGITHTTASAGAMDWITGLLSAPVQDWDALICTSTVVREDDRGGAGPAAGISRRPHGCRRISPGRNCRSFRWASIPRPLHRDAAAASRARAALGIAAG